MGSSEVDLLSYFVMGITLPRYDALPFDFPFDNVEPQTDGCYRAYGTSFDVGNTVFNLRFEASWANGDDYRGFCEEQGLSCETIFVMKFDNEFNVEPADAFHRLPPAFRLGPGGGIRLSKILAGAVQRFVTEYEATVIVGVPNDWKLERWYGRLAQRFEMETHLIAMRRSAYHGHAVLVISQVRNGYQRPV